MPRHALALHFAIALATCSALATLSTAVTAEQVRVPVGQGASVWSGKTPTRGSTKAAVEAEFGSPESRHGPSGEPPIYYWEYSDFTVYFEGEHVIHTVIKHRPK